MALVHHQMPVAGHNVVHNVAAFKALEHADVDEAPGLRLPPPIRPMADSGRSRNAPSLAVH